MSLLSRASAAALLATVLLAPTLASGAEPAGAPVSPVAPSQPRGYKLTPRGAVVAVGDRALLRATLTTADGKPVANANVVFSMNGVELGRGQTGGDGTAVAEHKVAETTKIGSNTVDVKALDTTGRVGATGILAVGTLNMAVFKAATFYSFPYASQVPPKGTTKGKFTVSLGLYRSTDQARVVGRNIRVTFLGRSQTVKQTEQGAQVTFDLGPEDQGKADYLEFAFEGDASYLANVHRSQGRYGIDPPPVTIPDFMYGIDDASPMQLAIGQSTPIKVYLRTASKKDSTPGLANTKFRVRGIGGPGYEKFDVGSGTTDATGHATFTYTHTTPVRPGKYELEVGIEKDGKIFTPSAASMADPTLHRGGVELVKTAPVITIVKAPKSVMLDEDVTVEVRMTRASDNKPFSFGVGMCSPKTGNCITSTTNDDGKATLRLPASKIGTGKQSLSLEALAFPDEPYERTKIKFDVDVFAQVAAGPTIPLPTPIKPR